jgi:nuclear pore complex protein Nup210
LEYSQCDAFSKFVSWGIFGADGVFATEKGISSSLFPPIHTMLEDSKAHGLVPAQEAALKLIHPRACAWTLLSVAQAGRASVTASLNVGDSLLEQTAPAIEHPSLETSWTIAAFAPLTLEQASSGDAHGGYAYKISGNEWGSVNTPQNNPLKELLLVPGSSMNVILRGGPERWGPGVEFVDSHEVRPDHGESMGAVAVTHLQEGRMRIYSINCKMLGNYVSYASSCLLNLGILFLTLLLLHPSIVSPISSSNQLVGCSEFACFVHLYINGECLLT